MTVRKQYEYVFGLVKVVVCQRDPNCQLSVDHASPDFAHAISARIASASFLCREPTKVDLVQNNILEGLLGDQVTRPVSCAYRAVLSSHTNPVGVARLMSMTRRDCTAPFNNAELARRVVYRAGSVGRASSPL